MTCVTTLPASSSSTSLPVPLPVTVTNPTTSVTVSNPVTVANPVTTVTVANPVTEVTVLNPVLDNKKTAILKAEDRDEVYTYADFGTINQRITQIDYSSPTVYPGETARRVFTYELVTLPSGRQVYKRTGAPWSII